MQLKTTIYNYLQIAKKNTEIWRKKDIFKVIKIMKIILLLMFAKQLQRKIHMCVKYC